MANAADAVPRLMSLPCVDSLNILQFNCNGLSSRLEELKSFLSSYSIKLAVLQETKLSVASRTPAFPGFAVIRKDRSRNSGGGLITLVHHSLSFTECMIANPDDFCEFQHTRIFLNDSHLDLFNVYFPPSSSCPPGHLPSLAGLLTGESRLVLGDLNAHDTLWHSPAQDARGLRLADEIDDSDFGVLNEDGAVTRLPSAGAPSCPDVSIASQDLLACASWNTLCTLGSDHLPMVISLPSISTVASSSSSGPNARKCFLNLRKANWPGFEAAIEAHLAHIPHNINIHNGLKEFNEAVLRAVTKYIPAGRVLGFSPVFPLAAKELASTRDTLRESDPQNPALGELNANIIKITADCKRERWREHVESLSMRDNPAQLWGTLKMLSNGCSAPPNQGITFEGRLLTDATKIATQFNKQFTSVRRHVSKKSSRIIRRKFLKLSYADPLVFTTEEVRVAIKKSKNSRALGPDNISMLYLKHLGPAAISHLTHILNLYLATCEIPAIWKTSTILPLLKPGKSSADSGSYRPISLLCPAVKVLERLLLPTLNTHIQLQPHQHGFRPQHSTVTALHNITDTIANGFNQPKPPHRTVLVALDLTKAFDSVDIDVLTDSLGESLPSGLARWLNGYLRGRQARVAFRNTKSRARNVKTGVPQGSVISPTLFNSYIAALPPPPDGIKLTTYADDITLLASGPVLQPLYDTINDYLRSISNFFSERSLCISSTKSSVTLFSSDSHQYNIHPQIFLDDQHLPLVQFPKILGVQLDPMLTLNRHATSQAGTAKKRNNLLKALAGSTWGQDTETLISTYRAIGKSVLEYAAPVLDPLLSKTSWTKLERAENSALRIATGCTAMTGSEHLHAETQIVPVREHCRLLSAQHLRNSLLPDHPNHGLLHRPPPPRHLKKTLVDDCRSVLSPLLLSPVSTDQIRAMNTALHFDTVASMLANRGSNRVLGEQPPIVNFRQLERQARLPRRTRVQLSQLRSGFSSLLHSYRARISPGTPDVCPDCQSTPHDTSHLFNCPAHPTDLRPIDLWIRPAAVAAFLNLPH